MFIARGPGFLALTAVNHWVCPVDQKFCSIGAVCSRTLVFNQGCFSSGIVKSSALMASLGATTSAAEVFGLASP